MTLWINSGESLARKLPSPAYDAVIEWDAAESDAIANVATPASSSGKSFPPQPEAAAQRTPTDTMNAAIRGVRILPGDRPLYTAKGPPRHARTSPSDHWKVAVPPLKGNAASLIEYAPAVKLVDAYWP